jgi:hypothetical protein
VTGVVCRLHGTIAGPPLQAISAGLLGAGTTKVDLWADTATMRATKITGRQRDRPGFPDDLDAHVRRV